MITPEAKTCCANAPFDRAHIAKYTLGDLVLEAEVIGIFQRELGKLLDSIRDAQSDQAYGFATHSLKGASRAVGAWKIAEIAEQLEKAGRGGTSRLIESLELAVTEAIAWSPERAS